MFPFTHIGGIVWLFTPLMAGFGAVLIEAFDPATTIPVLQREHGVTLAGAGTPFHMAYLAAQARAPSRRRCSRTCATFPGGGSPKPPQLHYDVKKRARRRRDRRRATA